MRVQTEERGFTLIEAMVALMVVSVALLALGAFTITVIRADSTANQRTVATHVAEQALEKWYSTNTPPLASKTVTVDKATYQFQSFNTTPVSGVSNQALTGNGPPADMRAITVYWRNASGVHKVTVTNMRRAE